MNQSNDPNIGKPIQSNGVENQTLSQKPEKPNQETPRESGQKAEKARQSFDQAPQGLLDRIRKAQNGEKTEYTYHPADGEVRKTPQMEGKFKDLIFSVIQHDDGDRLELMFFRENKKGKYDGLGEPFETLYLKADAMKELSQIVGDLLESGMKPKQIKKYLNRADEELGKKLEKDELNQSQGDVTDNPMNALMEALKRKMANDPKTKDVD